jgi:hypothetical protein
MVFSGILLVALAALSSTSSVAQAEVAGKAAAPDKPDFLGQWVLVNPTVSAANVPQELTVHESIERRSVRGATIDPPLITLTIERQTTSGTRSQTYNVGTEGGIVVGVTNGQSTRPRFSVKWDGDRLVIIVIERGSSGSTDSRSDVERQEVWSLDGQDRLFIVVTERGSGVGPRTSSFTYQRR